LPDQHAGERQLRVGVVGRQRQGAAERTLGLVEPALEAVDRSEQQQRIGVLRLELQGLLQEPDRLGECALPPCL
jgi:hypothetical protein